MGQQSSWQNNRPWRQVFPQVKPHPTSSPAPPPPLLPPKFFLAPVLLPTQARWMHGTAVVVRTHAPHSNATSSYDKEIASSYHPDLQSLLLIQAQVHWFLSCRNQLLSSYFQDQLQWQTRFNWYYKLRYAMASVTSSALIWARKNFARIVIEMKKLLICLVRISNATLCV